MSAVRMDGKALSAKVRGSILAETKALKEKGVTPGLAVIIVGNDPASEIYVQNFVSTTATVVVRLHHSASTAQTVRSLSAYMSRQGIPSSRVILSATPINSTSDTR